MQTPDSNQFTAMITIPTNHAVVGRVNESTASVPVDSTTFQLCMHSTNCDIMTLPLEGEVYKTGATLASSPYAPAPTRLCSERVRIHTRNILVHRALQHRHRNTNLKVWHDIKNVGRPSDNQSTVQNSLGDLTVIQCYVRSPFPLSAHSNLHSNRRVQ